MGKVGDIYTYQDKYIPFIHENDDTHECIICGERFQSCIGLSKYSLNNHIDNKHQDVEAFMNLKDLYFDVDMPCIIITTQKTWYPTWGDPP